MGEGIVPYERQKKTMILESIEVRAESVLRKLNIKGLPIPVEDIAGRLQIRISRAPSGEFSGMLLRKDGRTLIGVNGDEPAVRQRFTIAHELGHYFLHPNKDAFVDYRDNKKDVMRTPREKQANMFAAALLMPRQLIRKDVRALAGEGVSDDDVAVLARKYSVSEDALRFRLMNLHLFK